MAKLLAATRRFVASPSFRRDAALCGLVWTFVLVSALSSRPLAGQLGRYAAGWELSLLCGATVLLRRRWPLGALVAAGTLGSLYLLAGGGSGLPIVMALVIVLVGAVAYSPRSRPTTWTVAVAVCVVLAIVTVLISPSDVPTRLRNVLTAGGWMAMALMLGEALYSRKAYAQEAELRLVQAERAQQEQAQRRVVEERLQIARELHDVLAHTIALINVQAGVAAHVIDAQPEQARQSLLHIKQASHAGLQELRAVLSVLRDASPAPLAPAAGMDALDDLVAKVRAGGIDVDLAVCGGDSTERLPQAVGVAAYRIVQEALTNVIKHAGTTTARVEVCRQGRELRLRVTNTSGNGGDPGDGTGSGIAGMRERAEGLGGTLEYGATPSGGYEVHAVLPIEGHTP